MPRIARLAIVFTLLVAGDADALDKCKAGIKTKDGTIAVTATGVTGALLWGNTAGDATHTFFDPACLRGTKAKGCTLGAPGTLAAITPPAGCTIHLKDDAGTCAAYIPRCIPGVRDETRVLRLERIVGTRVFVTSTTSNGNLGGLTGADAICNARAAAASLGGNWVAWLSDSSTDARDRVSPVFGGFKTLAGDVIAADVADLVDGAIANAIQRDELNQEVSELVWTGTTTAGTKATSHCSDWTSAATAPELGLSGVSNSTDASWTQNGGGQGCSIPAALYCFERP